VTILQVFALGLVALGAPAVVLTRDPLRQALVVGIYGFSLAVLFYVFQAPDVSLSEIVVATIALPIMIVLALLKIAEYRAEREDEQE
jgi:energy-converting hydrogenase B subunit D